MTDLKLLNFTVASDVSPPDFIAEGSRWKSTELGHVAFHLVPSFSSTMSPRNHSGDQPTYEPQNNRIFSPPYIGFNSNEQSRHVDRDSTTPFPDFAKNRENHTLALDTDAGRVAVTGKGSSSPWGKNERAVDFRAIFPIGHWASQASSSWHSNWPQARLPRISLAV